MRLVAKSVKQWLWQLGMVMAFCLSHPLLFAANAAEIEHSVGSDGSITISGGNYPNLGAGDITTGLNGVLDKYKGVATFIFGACTITAFLMMIFMFTKLSVAGDNEQARRRAIGGILTCGVAIALLGGLTIVVGFFWGAIDSSAPSGTTP